MTEAINAATGLREKPEFADETTPRVRNCWYVAALSEEVTASSWNDLSRRT